MKQKLLLATLIACLAILNVACANDDYVPDELTQTRTRGMDDGSSSRLTFANEDELYAAITNGAPVCASDEFVSLMDTPIDQTIDSPQKTTYYEIMGYDTLVPNVDFAKLLNINGEVTVGKKIAKITADGTFLYPVGYEKQFEAYMSGNPNLPVASDDENTFMLNDSITFIRTFAENDDYYPMEYEGVDDVEEPYADDDSLPISIVTRSSSEPNMNEFAVFRADRKTVVGKILQNLIGAKKKHHIGFNNKRRLCGCFYFYNYGVYSEIGVTGRFEKKDWIGWSKTTCEELRVGWRHIILKQSLPKGYKDAMKNVADYVYQEPKQITVSNVNVNAATVILPSCPETLKSKIVSYGVYGVYEYLKNKLGSKTPSSLKDASACIVAAPTELYIIINDEDVKKYNAKSYTHVFAKKFGHIEIGWSNTNGFSINGINKNNVSQYNTWIKLIADAFNNEKSTLVSGEVYTCALFENKWKGMKIYKKNDL